MGNSTSSTSQINKIPPSIEVISHDSSDKTKPIVSVIVTICGGSSYDNLYQTVPQKAPEGGRISMYAINPSALDYLLKRLTNQTTGTINENFSVLFNQLLN